ncbi:MAG: hypothetical protein HC842_03190, partial [Cytophagales bacterium]|nr:hypothetical protein [Cytophagales bacterium]
MKKLVALGAMTLSLGTGNVFGQIEAFENILRAGESDANKIASAYMSPMLNAVGHSLNTNWNNTAKPHKLLGFDFTVGLSLAQAPSSLQGFEFRNSDYNVLKVLNAEPMEEQISGTDYYTASFDNNATFNLPTIIGDPDGTQLHPVGEVNNQNVTTKEGIA